MNKIASPFIVCMLLSLFGCAERPAQPELGHRSVEILQEGKFQFKDLNKNGRLDPYEDWRLNAEERASDLLSRMTVDEKIGFMIISQINMGPSGTSDLNEQDVVTTRNQFTGEATEETLNVSGTTKGILERHLRHFILRANAPARTMAAWSNNVQAVAESSRLGIPVIFTSNPRNHVAVDNSMGLNVGNSYFTQWPGTLGLAAADDPELVRQFAETAAEEWVACGIRKGYMYQLDLSTEPRWSRIEGTFGEDADRVSAIAKALVEGFQGKELGPRSVALTMKHFPGGGAEMKGWDSHYSYGKNLVYPGNMMSYHVQPFKAAVDAGVSGIMPYYARPHETRYEEVGSTYNHGLLTELLRNTLGFAGIINSDTGPINNMPWGVEELSVTERYLKGISAGTDLFSGGADIKNLKATYDAGMIDDEQVNTSVKRLLIEKFRLGLFENPYVDPDRAERVANSPEHQALAAKAFRKSIVLLRNDASVLPLKPGTKVFLDNLADINAHKGISPESNLWDIEFVEDIADAEVVLLWVTPRAAGGGFLGGSRGDTAISNLLSDNGVDTDYINQVSNKLPTILFINFSRPWVIQEINPGKAQTLLATFGTTLPSILDVVTGKFNPSGKLPFGIPSSQEAVDNNKEDVPSALEAEGYALFDCGFGLSY